MTDKLHIDSQHLAKVRNALAEEGLELTREELVEELDSIFSKVQGALLGKGLQLTKDEIRDIIHSNSAEILNITTFICSECGRDFPYNPNDPGSGGICAECAERAFEEAEPVEMTEEQLQRIWEQAVNGPLPELTKEEKAAMNKVNIEDIMKRIKEQEGS